MNVQTTKVLGYIEAHPHCSVQQLIKEVHIPKKCSRRTLQLLSHRNWIDMSVTQKLEITQKGKEYLKERGYS